MTFDSMPLTSSGIYISVITSLPTFHLYRCGRPCIHAACTERAFHRRRTHLNLWIKLRIKRLDGLGHGRLCGLWDGVLDDEHDGAVLCRHVHRWQRTIFDGGGTCGHWDRGFELRRYARLVQSALCVAEVASARCACSSGGDKCADSQLGALGRSVCDGLRCQLRDGRCDCDELRLEHRSVLDVSMDIGDGVAVRHDGLHRSRVCSGGDCERLGRHEIWHCAELRRYACLFDTACGAAGPAAQRDRDRASGLPCGEALPRPAALGVQRRRSREYGGRTFRKREVGA